MPHPRTWLVLCLAAFCLGGEAAADPVLATNLVGILRTNGQVLVQFAASQPAASTSPGWTNYYSLLYATNLAGGPWLGVPGYTNLVATNTVTYTNNVAGTARFFRLSLNTVVTPVYTMNPSAISGFSVPVVTCNDTNDVTPHGCTLGAPQVGVLNVTVTATNNYLDIPIAAEMNSITSSVPASFDTAIYKKVRLRLQADANLTAGAGFLLTWWVNANGTNSVPASVFQPFPAGASNGVWAVHQFDFSAVPAWTGVVQGLQLQVLATNGGAAAAADLGKSVRINRVELVAAAGSNTNFSTNAILLNVIQRTITNGLFRSVWENISNYNAAVLPTNLDGRIYYFGMTNFNPDMKAIHTYYNTSHPDYLDSDLAAPPAGYVDLGILGYVWTNQYPGMAVVQRATNSAGQHALIVSASMRALTNSPLLAGFKYETSLGYAYPRYQQPYQEYETTNDSMDDLYSFPSGSVSFGVNLSYGAAGWDWYYGTNNGAPKQNINDHDFGRQAQLAYYVFGTDPAEVGYNRGQVGNPVAHAHRIGNTLVTRTLPIDWNSGSDTLVIFGETAHPDFYPGLVLGKDVTFGILGHTNLCKWTAYVYSPVAMSSQLEIYSGHPTADFIYRASIDFTNGSIFVVSNTTDVANSYTFNCYPRSGLGGSVCATGTDPTNLAFGLMIGTYNYGNILANYSTNYYYNFAGKTNLLGSSAWANFSGTPLGTQYSSPFNNYTLAQRSVTRLNSVAGDNRYTVYVMSGQLSEVTNWMQDLYNNRTLLEW